MDEFYQRAYTLVTSPVAKKAFDLKEEPAKVRDEYGRHNFGQSCLLARRLVEAGVRCISINYNGWDTHTDNFNSLKKSLLPPLDTGYAALLADLKQRGLLDTTLVVWMASSAARPKSTAPPEGTTGRARSVLMRWAGRRRENRYGSGIIERLCGVPEGRPLRVEDVAATIYRAVALTATRSTCHPRNGRSR